MKTSDLIFEDRMQAGKCLAEKLIDLKLQEPLVIALPRGGVEVAEPVAKALGCKLEIIVSKKIGSPNNPELAVGAVTSHGDYVIAPYVETELGDKKMDYLQKQIPYLINDCVEREKKYLSGRDALPGRLYRGHDVIIVDDGIATGMTVMAAIKSIKKQNPSSLILAVPVISDEAYKDLRNQVDKLIVLKIPKEFVAVGVHYKHFESVDDAKINSILSTE